MKANREAIAANKVLMQEIERLKRLGQETVDELTRKQNEATQKEVQQLAQVSCIHLCSIKLVLTLLHQEQANADQARVRVPLLLSVVLYQFFFFFRLLKRWPRLKL